VPKAKRVHETRTIYIKSPVDVQLTLLASLSKKRGIEDIVLTADSDRVAEFIFFIELAERMFKRKLQHIRRWLTLVQTGKGLKIKREKEKEIESMMGASFEDLAKLLLQKSYEVRESL